MATIKKGTYRWNDEVTDLGYTTEIAIPFTLPPYVEISNEEIDEINSEITSNNIDLPLLEYGITTSFVCNSIMFYKGYDYHIVSYGIEAFSYSSDNPVLNFIHGESREKIYEAYHSIYGTDETKRNFTVLEDTVVDDEAFATWFTENTQMLIKAGTYKFKYELNFDNLPFNVDESVFAYELPFTITFNIEGIGEVTLTCLGFAGECFPHSVNERGYIYMLFVNCYL